MAEESSKWLKSEITVDLAIKLTEFLKEFDGDGDLIPTVKEEMVEEVMQELYKEITSASSACTTNPTSLQANIPSPSSLLPLSPPLSVFSDGKSESCGPSLSDSASTVMAGIEFAGPAGKFAPPESGFNYGMDGSDCWEVDDDEWLARVLGWDPPELDQCII